MIYSFKYDCYLWTLKKVLIIKKFKFSNINGHNLKFKNSNGLQWGWYYGQYKGKGL